MKSDPTLAEALALGGTRIATAAHPMCVCGTPRDPEPDSTGIWDDAVHERWLTDLRAWRERNPGWRKSSYLRTKADCPMHGGTR